MLASEFAAGMKAGGAEVEVMNLADKKIGPCDACNQCECGERDFCVHQDDMTNVMKAVKKADAVVAATPVWWTGMSSQMKIFIDRLYGYKTKDYFGGKPLFLITAYFEEYEEDAPLPGEKIAAYTFQSIADFAGMDFVGHLRSDPAKGSVITDSKMMVHTFNTGKRFAGVLDKVAEN